MTKGETKRCHFVPKTYLEKFTNASDNNKIITRKKEGGDPFLSSLTSVCVRKHLYILPGETQEDRQIIERFYGENIESNYNAIYNILNDSSVIDISENDREMIIATVITLLFRNPFILDRFNEFWANTIDRLFTLAQSTSSRTFQIDKKLINIDKITQEEFNKESRSESKHIFNITHIRQAMRLIEIRKNDCISVTEIMDDNEYITSDNPVSISNTQAFQTGIFDPTNFLRLPINQKKCVVIYPHGTDDFEEGKIYRRPVSSTLSLLDILYINNLQYFYSNRLLFGSHEAFGALESQIRTTDDEIIKLSQKAKAEMNKELLDKLNELNNLI